MMEFIGVHVTPITKLALYQEALARGISTSALVREILQKMLLKMPVKMSVKRGNFSA